MPVLLKPILAFYSCFYAHSRNNRGKMFSIFVKLGAFLFCVLQSLRMEAFGRLAILDKIADKMFKRMF